MLIRKIFIVVLVLIAATSGQLLAQAKAKKAPKNTHYGASSVSVKNDSNTILLPDFFQYGTVKKGDTGFSYEFYTKGSDKIDMYDLKDIDQVIHIKYFKMFREFPDPKNSNISAPTEYIIQYEYGHPSSGLWVRFDPATGETTHYNIYKNKIVGIDSATLTNPKTNVKRHLIYKYFKTEVISKEISKEGEEHIH